MRMASESEALETVPSDLPKARWQRVRAVGREGVRIESEHLPRPLFLEGVFRSALRACPLLDPRHRVAAHRAQILRASTARSPLSPPQQPTDRAEAGRRHPERNADELGRTSRPPPPRPRVRVALGNRPLLVEVHDRQVENGRRQIPYRLAAPTHDERTLGHENLGRRAVRFHGRMPQNRQASPRAIAPPAAAASVHRIHRTASLRVRGMAKPNNAVPYALG